MLELVEFDQLKLFRDIAQHRSLTKAAALSGISQSAASQQIQELERSFGTRLLDRTTRPLTLTEAGRLYYEFCRDVLRREEEFDAALGTLKKDVEGTVRVASIYSVGLSEMSRLEEEFARRFPEARLAVEYLRPEKIYAAVLADQADLGLVSYPTPSKQIAVIPWREEEMVLATAPAHALARKAVAVPADLRGVDFAAFDPDLPIRREIDRYLREHGVEVNLHVHFDNIPMMKEAVALGVAVSILPARILRTEVEQGRIAAVPISPGLVRPVGIIHRKRKKFNRATQAFLGLLQGDRPHVSPATDGGNVRSVTTQK